jgi:hypothetical protein
MQKLFIYNKNVFTPVAGVYLTLVLFVDDLDRVLGEGRNVKMLEAIQLLLNVPGAPVLVFLAIDSRIVVASIEQHINKSMKIEDAMVTGWEYLEKIVQIPFCIPEITPERVQHYLSTILIKSTTVEDLEEFLNQFQKTLEDILQKPENKLLWCKFPLIHDNNSWHRVKVVDLVTALSATDRIFEVGKILVCPSMNKIGSKEDEEASETLRGEIQITLSKVQFYLKSNDAILPDSTDAPRNNAPNAKRANAINANADEKQSPTPNDDGEILIKVPVILREGLKFLLI